MFFETFYTNNSHFVFSDFPGTIIKTTNIQNFTPAGASGIKELTNFSINMWIYITNRNTETGEQSILVLGDVGPSNVSITPDTTGLNVNKFQLSLK
jgi:hypothetical protein